MAGHERGSVGSSFAAFLDEHGLREETEAQALDRLRAWHAEGLASGPAGPLTEDFAGRFKAPDRSRPAGCEADDD